MYKPNTTGGLYDPDFEHDACGVGFVADIHGRCEHDIVEKSLEILVNLTHRGAVGADPRTGDGAGILMQLPDQFLKRECAQLGFTLPETGQYAAGMIFLPLEQKARKQCVKIFSDSLKSEGLEVLGWRDVPVDPNCIGETARLTLPFISQVFVKNPGLDQQAFERKLYVARKVVENAVYASEIEQVERFYIASFSSKTIVYKGLLLADQITVFYPDLVDPEIKTALAIVHQRYSTNTMPTWDLAHPFRYMAHNGEINTLRGNVNRIRALEKVMHSDLFGKDLQKLYPIVREGQSDSACLDNVAELLYQAGRRLPHSMMMLVPEPFGVKYHIGPDRRAFYEFHAAVMEPWDGPAAIAFTDGDQVGAILDRNGLRPARYTITKSGLVVMASEAGVLDIPPVEVEEKGRLRPGRMFLVDTKRGRIVDDVEIKSRIVRQKPYRRWIVENQLKLKGLFETAAPVEPDHDTLLQRQMAFGFTTEAARSTIKPMVLEGKEPTGSMGNDTPLAVLSSRPQLLFGYFKQLFAQVTNPPIDPMREELVMSLMSFVGRDGNLLAESPEHCRLLKLPAPVLTNDDMERIKNANQPDLKTATVSTLYPADGSNGGLKGALERMCALAEEKVRAGATMLVLSDRGINAENAAAPILLSVSAVHHHLIKAGLRAGAGIMAETGEVWEVMHFALLIGYGASGINPYVAFETIADLAATGEFPDQPDCVVAMENYIKAVKKGLLKVMSKMGISTIRSYRGAQIFEAVGLGKELIENYFPNTVSRIGGVELDTVEEGYLKRHRKAFSSQRGREKYLDRGGTFAWRKGEEEHLWTPETITSIQRAARENSQEMYNRFAVSINEQDKRLLTLRGLFSFKKTEPVPIEEVEPVENIFRRFATGAMSHGSISREAHESIAIAMNRIGGMSNSGEGGEDPARFTPDPNGDSRSSFVKQVASGRFGVTTEYLVNGKEIQIKIAQGAKPGEGGQLPGHKVNREIARLRFSTPGVTLISPPPHHDIYSIEDLAQLIFDLKNVNPSARISVKLVSEIGVGTVAAGVSKGHADMVLISGHDGGTGASPTSSIYNAGIPWEIGLAETQQVLVANDLRDRIRVQVDGQIRTGRDVVVGALLGAEEFGFATVALVTQGCVMMRKCHKNSCPVGVATQDPELRKNFKGRPEHLVNYLTFVASEVRQIMAQLGFRKFDDMIGRVDMLDVNEAIRHWKTRNIDLSRIFARPDAPPETGIRCTRPQDASLEKQVDIKLIEKCRPAIENFEPVSVQMPIRNVNRAVGTMLSGSISKKHGLKGLPPDTIRLKFTGSAGQSFGAWLVNGVSLELEGEANDYLGKGMSGGRIVVYPSPRSTFEPYKNVIVGNTLLYGATGGEIYIRGIAGERFAVRNSGAKAVIEGLGDHGCEYMTGGTVIVLGQTGLNFAAGMSGGIAYVLDEDQLFDAHCNLDMVDLELVTEPEDITTLKDMIENHVKYTRSHRGLWVLENWDGLLPKFVKVMPTEYRRALMEIEKEREADKAFKPFRGQVPQGVSHE